MEQLRGTLLDPWSWSAFLGEQGGLAAIYAEAEDLASKRCISKVGPSRPGRIYLSMDFSSKVGGAGRGQGKATTTTASRGGWVPKAPSS